MWKKWIDRLQRTKPGKEILDILGLIGRNKVAAKAAALSFYLFLAMIPLFTLLCSLLPFTGISAVELTQAIWRVTPEAVHALVDSVVQSAYSARVSVFSVSCIVLLWSSAKLMKALIHALDAIYGKEGVRGYFAVTVRSLLYTLGLILVAGALLFFYVKGHSLEEFMALTLALTQFFGRWAAVGRFLCLGALLALLFALIYQLAPAGRRRYAGQLPGALFSSVGVSLFTLFFSFYSSGSNLYNSFYGSLTGVAFLLVWVYACFQIFLIGGILNRWLEEKRVSSGSEPG